MKKLFSLLLVFVMMFSFAACGKKEEKKQRVTQTTQTTTKAPEKFYNPLTGESGFSKSKLDSKPVAVMINNISVAQRVQCGLKDADIVYETLAEGGITRMMAVFADVSKVDRIGSVRSARISYAQLAAGHDAYYVHHGADNKYCGSSYRSSIGLTSMDLGGNAASAGQRISNGLSSEHTSYTFGNKITDYISRNYGKDTVNSANKGNFKFADEKSPQKFDKEAKNVAIKFSAAQTTYMRYNSDDQMYIRGNSSQNLVDYVTGDKVRFKNVFVLYTNIYNLSDGYHVQTDLSSGTGYYFSQGSYKEIKWSKGSATSPLKLYNTDGSELKINAGNSYIGFADTDYKSSLNIERF